jgi:long-chain fatty acid transport protein
MVRVSSRLIAIAIGAGLGGAVSVGVLSTANAGGFQLFEPSAVAIGNFGAGMAAEASDASVNFFNPAGLTRFKTTQVVGFVGMVDTGAKVTGTSQQTVLPSPLFPPYVESGAAQGGTTNPLPAVHIARPLAPNVVAGLSITAPFGLSTEYGDSSFVRYQGSKSELITVDVNPSLAVKLTDKLSVGLGVSAQYAKADLNSVAGIPQCFDNFACNFLPPLMETDSPVYYDSTSWNSGFGWGFGINGGVLYEFNEGSRIGVGYRGKIQHNLKGDSRLTGPLASTPSQVFESNDLQSDINLPATTYISAYHEFDERWALLLSAFYTQWNTFDEIVLRNVASTDNQLIDVSLPQNFRNTWRLMGGFNYKASEHLLFRAAMGYDQTPTNDADRSIRLPDGDRIAVSVGVSYHVSENVRLDVGYAHLFIRDGIINATTITGGQEVTVNARTKNRADLLGIQVTWNIDGKAIPRRQDSVAKV